MFVPSTETKRDLNSLEAAASAARTGFACMFSTSDEYERALISARRAEGRYGTPFDWQAVLLTGCVLVLGGLVLLAL